MKVTYDPEADAMYIYLSKGEITNTKEISPGVIADYAGKKLLGIELLDASDKLEKKNLKTIKSLPFKLL